MERPDKKRPSDEEQAPCKRIPSLVPRKGKCIILAVLNTLSSLPGLNCRKPDLELTEFFCGKKALTDSFNYLNMPAEGFDRELCKDCDFLTTSGYCTALALLLRLRIKGVAWFGTPCSSWIFLSRGSTKRSRENPLGDPGSAYITSQNKIVARVVLMIKIAGYFGAHWVVEQPSSSIMDLHPTFARLRRMKKVKHSRSNIQTLFLNRLGPIQMILSSRRI